MIFDKTELKYLRLVAAIAGFIGMAGLVALLAQGAFAADLPHEFGEPRQGAAAEQDPGGQTVVGEIHHAVLPPVVSPGVAGANPSTPARPYCTAAARYLARRLRSASNSRRRCGVVFG